MCKWIASREITKEQFDSKKAARIGTTKEKKCLFIKNTADNVSQIVLGKKLIKKASVAGINSKTYTGKAITQKPIVKLGSTVLKQNTDYKVSYKNNTNSGTATVTITGKGNYAGTINKTFKINPRSISNTTVALSASKVWTGSTLTPAPIVKYGSTKLKKGTHYSLVYKNNKNVGTAVITITGKGNFSGTAKKTFLIIPKSTSILRLTPGTKKYTVFWKKQTSQTTGYQIQYSTRSDFKTKKTITLGEAGKTSKAVSGLAKKSKYYIRVRTYKKVGSKKYYSTWSSTKAVTTK